MSLNLSNSMGLLLQKFYGGKLMRNKILLALVVAVTFLTGTFIGGYGSWNSDATVNASEEYTLEELGAASPLYANEVRDKDTGVHYFYNRNFMCP